MSAGFKWRRTGFTVFSNQCAAEYRRIKKCAECIQAVKEHNGGTDNGTAGFG